MPIRLVLFDLDDTLCDHSTSFRLRVERALAALPPAHLALHPQAVVQLALAQADHTWAGVQQVLKAAGIRSESLLQQAFAVYSSDRFYGLQLFPDCLPVVRAVQARVLTGLVTNGPSDIQRAKLDRLGIRNLFPIVVISEEVGLSKPDPRIFALALSLAGVPPEEALYVGDHPENDVRGAQGAGLLSVWCNRFSRPWPEGPQPLLTVTSLWEFGRMLERWASGSQSELGGQGILQRGGACRQGG